MNAAPIVIFVLTFIWLSSVASTAHQNSARRDEVRSELRAVASDLADISKTLNKIQKAHIENENEKER